MARRLGVTEISYFILIAAGSKWIWSQVSAHLPGSIGVLDIYHASEHLWAAANGHFGEGTIEARSWASARRTNLLEQGAAGLLRELFGGQWSGLRGYFESHVNHTGYATRLAEGRVIGSGLVEGSCKQVVCRRLKQTGARWRVRRVERMATLCAVQASQQWDAYWKGAA